MTKRYNIMDKNKIVSIKNIFPETLANCFGNVSTACKRLEISRTTYYRWLKEDEDFKQRCLETEEIILDNVETELFKLIKKGNTAAILFYLKTKGKHRGYTEQPGINVNVGTKIEEVVINVKERE